MLEEDAVPPPNGHLAIAFGIPGEAKTRRRIEQMPLQTARISRRTDTGRCERVERGPRNIGGSSRTAALDDSIERIPASRNKGSIRGATTLVNGGGVGSVERTRLEVKGPAVTLAVGSIEAEPQPEIQSKSLGHPPVVLEIRFNDPVAVVILSLQVGLLVLGDISHQQIGKRVSCANGRVARIER